MKYALAVLVLFVGYEFVAAKVNESADNSEKDERQEFELKNPSNSFDYGSLVTPNTNRYIAPKRTRLPKITRWFSKKPS